MAVERTRPLTEPDEASIAPRLPSREQEEAPAPSALTDPPLPAPSSLAGATRPGRGQRPGRAATLHRMQQTEGNRAALRLLQQAPAGPPILIQRRPEGAGEEVDHARDLDKRADLGEEEQREQMQAQPPPAMQVNNIQDASGARMRMEEIEGFRPQMQDGGRTGTVDGTQISANENAISTLANYLVTVGEQGRTLSTFQTQLQQVRLDYGRVQGQMIHLEAMGVVDKGQTAAYRAEQIVGAATGAGSAEESAAGIAGEARTERNALYEAQDSLKSKGNDVSRAQREASAAVHALNSALRTLNSGIIPREEDPELAATQRAIKGKVSTMQSRLATGLQVISTVGGATGLSGAASAAATEAYGGAMTTLGQQALGAINPKTITDAISEEWYREETNAIQSQIDQAHAQKREDAKMANVSGVDAAQTVLFSALRTLEEKMSEYQDARDRLRTILDNLGDAAAKQRGGEGYEVITGLLGDVAVLVTQIDTTIGLGQTEEHAAGQATEKRSSVEGTRNAETGTREGGVLYFRPYQDFQLANFGRSGGLVYRATENRILFVTNERSPGSAYGGEGAANPVVKQTMAELAELRETVEGMRDVLSRSLGLQEQR